MHGDTLIVALYVRDLVIIGNTVNLILSFKKRIIDSFEMNKLSLSHFFFNVQVLKMHESIFISQPIYVVNMLK